MGPFPAASPPPFFFKGVKASTTPEDLSAQNYLSGRHAHWLNGISYQLRFTTTQKWTFPGLVGTE